jgi:hypothetical protein
MIRFAPFKSAAALRAVVIGLETNVIECKNSEIGVVGKACRMAGMKLGRLSI